MCIISTRSWRISAIAFIWLLALMGCSSSTLAPGTHAASQAPLELPKPAPRADGDGLAMILKLAADLDNFSRTGGYRPSVLRDLEKEDPQAADVMLKEFASYLARARVALAAPYVPYQPEPDAADLVSLPGKPGSWESIMWMLRGKVAADLRRGNLTEATLGFRDLRRLGGMEVSIPSSFALRHEVTIDMLIGELLIPSASKYHKSEEELKALISAFAEKFPPIPVATRVRTDAALGANRIKKSDYRTPFSVADQLKAHQAATEKLIKIAEGCGTDWSKYIGEAKQLKSELQQGSRPESYYQDPKNLPEMALEKELDILFMGGSSFMGYENRGALLRAWLAAEKYRLERGSFPDSLEQAGFVQEEHGQWFLPIQLKRSGSSLRVWFEMDARSGAGRTSGTEEVAIQVG